MRLVTRAEPENARASGPVCVGMRKLESTREVAVINNVDSIIEYYGRDRACDQPRVAVD